MTGKLKLPFLVLDRDRHGNLRIYVRVTGRPKIRIRATIGSAEFMAAYNRAIEGAVETKSASGLSKPGSFRHTCVRYLGSAEFKTLDVSTQRWRRHHLDSICDKHADKPIAMLQSRHVRQLRDELSQKPVVANVRLKALRALFAWAVEADAAPHDPTIGVRPLKHVTDGFHTWDLNEVEQYERRHPVGSQARMAMALLLYTACRREDVVRLGPQHLREGRLRYRQAKNEHRNPVDLDIPVHPDLQNVLDASRSGHLTFLATVHGRPFSVAGFGNKFRKWCDQAGLPDCSAHGLRKAAATRLAERGATAHEIMAVTGHRSLEEVERYTRAARQGRLADSAMAKLKEGTDAVPPTGEVGQKRQKPKLDQR